ncbi:protein-tyrosine phosphatase [Ruminococcaceae bacterium YRB3002]|nr:protein-tyrosine phosphatase [Ruminococcaceae bacterium YRB3002]
MNGNIIELPGIKNARELGGYTAGDRTVKRGLLIRSGAICNAEPEALAILADDYHVQAIIDFRMNHVMEGTPDPEVPGAVNTRLPVAELEDYISWVGKPVDAGQFTSAGIEKSVMFDMAYELGIFSPAIYDLFITGERGIAAYRGFFRILLDSDPDNGAVLWHCVGGKDRAGLASMLLLTALGADRDTIMRDYLLTNECNAAKLGVTRKNCEDAHMPPEKMEARIFVSGGVFEKYLTHAISTLENKYGSVNGYLREGLGLTDGDIGLLREKYTE